MGFENFKFQHIKRGGNRVAHLLAKEGSRGKRDMQWIEEGPMAIEDLVETEKNNSVP